MKERAQYVKRGTERKTQPTLETAVYNFQTLPPSKVTFLYLPCLANIRSVLVFIQIHHRKCPGGQLGRAAGDAEKGVSSTGPRHVPQTKGVYVTVPGIVFGWWRGALSKFL